MILRMICLCFAIVPALPADNSALDAWLKRQATIATLETPFAQERTLPSLKQPLITPGKLAFSKPGRVRWQPGHPPPPSSCRTEPP